MSSVRWTGVVGLLCLACGTPLGRGAPGVLRSAGRGAPDNRIYFEAIVPDLGLFRIFRFNYLAEGPIETLSTLNSTWPLGDETISSFAIP